MNKGKIRSFNDLIVWQIAMELVKDIYTDRSVFPNEEKYGLTSQIRRASASVPSNIAEGQARIGNNEYRHFLSIAMGSCAKLEIQILISVFLNFLTVEKSEQLIGKLHSISKMLHKLYQKLKEKNK